MDHSSNLHALDEVGKLRAQLSHYKKKAKKLEEKIEDHQLLE